MVKARRHDTGREGLTAEQVLRCCILKQYRQLSYEEVAFHLDDASAFRTFSRLEMGQYPGESIPQEKTKSLSEETCEAIHSQIIDSAQDEKIWTGRKIRIDSKPLTQTFIIRRTRHFFVTASGSLPAGCPPACSFLPSPVYPFSGQTMAAKKRPMSIRNTQTENVRLTAYRELLFW